MQSVRTHIPPTIFETFPRAISSTSSRSLPTSPPQSQTLRQFRSSPQTPQQQPQQQQRKPPQDQDVGGTSVMSTATSFSEYKISTTTVPTAPSVSLSDPQKIITGSILDLFTGRPSLRKLSLWTDDATYVDPLTTAQGRKQFEPQFYGLRTAYSNIERLNGRVTSGGNPIELDLKTRYTVKGVEASQTVDSKVKIFTEGEGEKMKIRRVEDRWNDDLPDSPIRNAMRNFNSVVKPTVVNVPKSIEEEEATS
ncbi:hypothetical protein LTS08_003082 [Lithohypha guttulata]|nr:hypothetical protein LTS08_003082 [Lithohypha guttulata]